MTLDFGHWTLDLGLEYAIAYHDQKDDCQAMVDIDDICEPEWAQWYQMTPQQRWQESQKLWHTYLALGGSLDPEPDTESPFFDADAPGQVPAHGRAGVRAIRRSGV